jgi:alpha-1,3-mannosyltransferase
VLSDIPPFHRLHEKSQQGLLVEPGNPQKLIDQLLSLHGEGEESYQLRREAASTFSYQYAWPAIADKYVALYETLGVT